MARAILSKIVAAILVCLLIGFLSSVAVESGINGWYSTIAKPVFTPPNWLFIGLWIIFYILMGVSVGIVWSKGSYHKWVKTAIYHFGFQLFLSALWFILFFGLQLPLIALLVAVALLVLIALTIKWFKIVNNTAAYLLIPYFIWVIFNTLINFEIWRLN